MIKSSIRRQRKILNKTYTDEINVYRSIKLKDGIGETKFKQVEIYIKQPCYLSISGLKSSQKTTIAHETNNEYVIFADKDIVLEEGDKVVVFKDNMRYEGRSSRSYKYDTHTETILKIEGVV